MIILAIANVLTALALWLRSRHVAKASDARSDVLQTALDDLRIKYRKLQDETDARAIATHDRDMRIDGLTEQLRRQESSSREVERTNATLQGRLTEQREIFIRQLADQSTQITQLTISLDKKNEELAELKQSLTTKDADLTKANETIARLEVALTKETQERLSIEKRVKALEVQVAELTAEREQIIKERDDALAKVAERDAEIARLKDEIAKLKAQYGASIAVQPTADQSATLPAPEASVQ